MGEIDKDRDREHRDDDEDDRQTGHGLLDQRPQAGEVEPRRNEQDRQRDEHNLQQIHSDFNSTLRALVPYRVSLLTFGGTPMRLARVVKIAAGFTLCASHAIAQTPREVAEKVMPSVVLLMMQDQHGQPLAMASGFVVRDGIVATNLHAIEGAGSADASLVDTKPRGDEKARPKEDWRSDPRIYSVKGVVASDPEHDLVLLSVDGLEAAPLTVADSEQVAIGDAVYVVGNPQGLEGTFSAGIVSGIRKVGEDSLLQITAPISPGSSGGPVLNAKGEVIGVAVATFKGGQNLNFAIPSQYLLALIPAIKAPLAFPEAAKATKGKKKTSILDDVGGRSTEGVTASRFLWTHPSLQWGNFSFSLRNELHEPVQDVICLVVFYGNDGRAIDVVRLRFSDIILPGLAKRITAEVDDSVQKLTTPKNDHAPKTKLEFRILYFDIVNPEEPADEHSAAPPIRTLPDTAAASVAARPRWSYLKPRNAQGKSHV